MKIICIGRNYVEHAKELNNPVPTKNMGFVGTGLFNSLACSI